MVHAFCCYLSSSLRVLFTCHKTQQTSPFCLNLLTRQNTDSGAFCSLSHCWLAEITLLSQSSYFDKERKLTNPFPVLMSHVLSQLAEPQHKPPHLHCLSHPIKAETQLEIFRLGRAPYCNSLNDNSLLTCLVLSLTVWCYDSGWHLAFSFPFCSGQVIRPLGALYARFPTGSAGFEGESWFWSYAPDSCLLVAW